METETPRYSASDIANYFLFKANQEGQELLSNLKLQKLVYYAQGLHLVVYGKPIFSEMIVAWNYGPVVQCLYHAYKDNGANGIASDVNFNPLIIDEQTREFLDEIYETFGQFSAIRLMEISHTDDCWKNAGIKNEISLESMRTCLRKYLKNG
ncbi:MAG: DUF4065 domain-containing protein [Proteobacteria bacterium]|nr:DUF4065 domain-containing protein [Pseudomonadota bacterium]MBU4472183.1 DUF4065 domain-containing protein [Pseudomonadota bacterium]MCG2750392.1 DUF4065 domain-containing protein [Desulfobacteraceae bacterium]